MGYGLRITGYGTCIGWSVQTEHALDFPLSFVILYATTVAMVLYLYLYLYVHTRSTQFDTQFHSLHAKRIIRVRHSIDTCPFYQENLLSLSNNRLPSCICFRPFYTVSANPTTQISTPPH
jgi:hypothetical protein